MEINEVKIGDVVSYKNKKGKMMKGTVIHRHADKGNLALMGMVNVKPLDDESYPETVHVSTIKKAIKEETNMEHIREAIDELIGHVESGNHVEAEKIFQSLLQDKVDDLLDAAKVEVASSMFNTQECAECSDDVEEVEVTSEALQGSQHKIDANKNGKLDALDFKMLRKKKGMKEEVEQVTELSQKTKDSYVAKRGSQLSSMMHGPSKNYNLLSGKKQANAVKGIKRALNKDEVEQTQEAYSDPYAAKKAAEMKKSYKKNMTDAKKEYDAAKKPKFAKNFMKMKEQAEVLGEEEYDYYRDYKNGGASYDEYKSASRNFQSRERKMYAKKRAPEVKEPHSVHINGKKWKSFSSHGHATNVVKKMAAKGGNKKFTVHKD